MYDPVYFVESLDVPLCLVSIGELQAFIKFAGHAAPLCTVWCVDELGQMVIVMKERSEPT